MLSTKNEAPLFDGYQILPRRRDDINETLNVEELIAEYDISVFPLPAQHIINVRSNERLTGLNVLSLNGQKLMDTNESSIDISSISPGNYILQIIINEELISYPITKI